MRIDLVDLGASGPHLELNVSILSSSIAKVAFSLPRGGYLVARAAGALLPELRVFARKMESFDYVMRCDLRESVFYPLAKYGRYPHARGEEIVLSQLARPDWIVLDIGANIGYAAAMFARLCPNGRVYAFEPVPKCTHYLAAVASDFDNIEVISKALGATSGIAHFQQRHLLDRSSISETGDIEVEITSVDDWCAQTGVRPSFLKIDVEGFDESVIDGALSTLRQARPIVMFEANIIGEFRRIDAKLRKEGYDVKQITPEGALREGWNATATRNFIGFPLHTSLSLPTFDS
jgi:FkbM family methyltransferase